MLGDFYVNFHQFLDKQTDNYQNVKYANGSITECYASSLDLGGQGAFPEVVFGQVLKDNHECSREGWGRAREEKGHSNVKAWKQKSWAHSEKYNKEPRIAGRLIQTA